MLFSRKGTKLKPQLLPTKRSFWRFCCRRESLEVARGGALKDLRSTGCLVGEVLQQEAREAAGHVLLFLVYCISAGCLFLLIVCLFDVHLELFR